MGELSYREGEKGNILILFFFINQKRVDKERAWEERDSGLVRYHDIIITTTINYG